MSLLRRAIMHLARRGSDPLEIARILGIDVVFWPMQSASGVALSFSEQRFVVLKPRMGQTELQLACGHMLYFFSCYPEDSFLAPLTGGRRVNKHELEANMFAVSLLLGGKLPPAGEKMFGQLYEAARRNNLSRLAKLVDKAKLFRDDELE